MALTHPAGTNPVDIRLDTRESNETRNRIVDLSITVAASENEKARTVWLESLSSELTASNELIRIQLSRVNPKPWTDRPSRFGEPPTIQQPPRDWNSNQFANLVKVILSDHTQSRTIDDIKNAMSTHLNKNERDKMTLKDWRQCVFGFVAKPKQPFREFVEKEVKKTRSMPPAPPSPPKAPGADASQAEKETFAAAQREHEAQIKEFNTLTREWNDAVESGVNSWLWLTQFLSETENGDKSKADARDFARVLLGIDAWLALDNRKEALEMTCKEVSLDSILSATLTLQWTWPEPRDLTSVIRFEIEPGGQHK